MEWISLIMSAVLTIAMSTVGWLIGRLVARIDKIENKVMDMAQSTAERDTQQDGRLEALEGRAHLTREDLRDVLEIQLAKATEPITRELTAIKVSSTDTRERLVKLESIVEAKS